MTSSPDGPPATSGLVTICIPTFNGARWLQEAIESALAQTYGPIEVLIVDDASADETAAIAQSYGKERIQFVANPVRVGMVTNWNRCIELARGEFIKFLLQDDVLRRDCVEQLIAPMLATPSVGLAFSPRSLLLERPEDQGSRLWAARVGRLHQRFGKLDSVNPGRRLLTRKLAAEPFRNWIGEPSAVLVRATCSERVGRFNPRLQQLVDAEMWLRIMSKWAWAS